MTEPVTTQRQKHYGDPCKNFANINDLFVHFEKSRVARHHEEGAVDLEPERAAAFREYLHMLAVKISRLCFDPTHADSLQDIAGYSKAAASFLCPDYEWKEV